MSKKDTQLNKTNEFSKDALNAPNVDKMSSIGRRKFLALLGASSALAVTACNDYRDKGEIITYNKKPENITYGSANYYASTYRDGSAILIKTREGRPIGVVGNPEHPISKGKASIQAHSAVLDLYDPERLKKPLKQDKETNYKSCDAEIIAALGKAKADGKSIIVFADDFKSPTFAKLIEEFKVKYGNVEVYSTALFNDEHRRASMFISYMKTPSYPAVKWEDAKIIVALEADILGTEGRVVEQIKGYSSRRNADSLDDFNRLYAVEGGMSLTGSNADYRIRLNPLHQYDLLTAIYNELIEKLAPMGFSSIGNNSIDKVASEYKISREVLNTLLNDLLNNSGKAILYAGDQMPFEIHLLVNLINEVIGGTQLYNLSEMSVSFIESIYSKAPKEVMKSLKSGKYAVAVFLDCNPAYTMSDDFGFAQALKNIPTKICLSEYENETSKLCDYVMPISHPFESWGDYQDRTGTISLRQPVIEPLYSTRQAEAQFLVWTLGDANSYGYDLYHKYLKDNWFNQILPQCGIASTNEDLWYASLHNGFVKYDVKPEALPKFNVSSLNMILPTPPAKGLTVVLKKSAYLSDGRYASNGWLQEIPHPVSKVIWDNYIAMAPATAKAYGVDYGKDFKSNLVDLFVNGKKITAPILTQPGMAENVVEIEIGYGRSSAGTIGTNVGVNAVKLLSDNGKFIVSNGEMQKKSKKYKLFASQEFHKLEDEFVKDFHRIRQIIQDGTVAGFAKNQEMIQEKRIFTEKEIEEHSVNPPHKYDEVKWAMAIDLNKCIACSNCVASCNVENNIPIVGKEECGKGREMHWMRIDRYYSGTSEEPIISHQPMICQHCDMAPCENVCPVVATTHSTDGLNQMTYNRCVGTRYCANNCPYKVRRFNFFDFRHRFADGYYEKDSLELIHNPEVTIRSRGVMEKCTFCVQRLSEGRQEATKKGETFDGKGIKTACQEACPADAIVFGNLNDPDSEISKLLKHKLGYKVLEVLAVKPNVTYLAKLRNTNTEDKL